MNDFDKLQKHQYNNTHGIDNYLMKKMIITNQKKSNVLLMAAMYYVKVMAIKILSYQLINILT